MSLTVFLAFCILGCDFLLYVLFQWIYGNKHRNHPRRSAGHRAKAKATCAFCSGGSSDPCFLNVRRASDAD